MTDENENIPPKDGTGFDWYSIRIELPEPSDRMNPERLKEKFCIGESVFADATASDHDDLLRINHQLDADRLALFKLSSAIRKAEREELRAKARYECEYNRAYMMSEAKPDSARKSMAEMQTEKWKNKWAVARQLTRELVRTSQDISNDLDTLKVLSYNMRKEMDL